MFEASAWQLADFMYRIIDIFCPHPDLGGHPLDSVFTACVVAKSNLQNWFGVAEDFFRS